MSIFELRYKKDLSPIKGEDAVQIEAAIFKARDGFLDFFSESSVDMVGRPFGKGDIVFRVSEDIVASVKKLS